MSEVNVLAVVWGVGPMADESGCTGEKGPFPLLSMFWPQDWQQGTEMLWSQISRCVKYKGKIVRSPWQISPVFLMFAPMESLLSLLAEYKAQGKSSLWGVLPFCVDKTAKETKNMFLAEICTEKAHGPLEKGTSGCCCRSFTARPRVTVPYLRVFRLCFYFPVEASAEPFSLNVTTASSVGPTVAVSGSVSACVCRQKMCQCGFLPASSKLKSLGEEGYLMDKSKRKQVHQESFREPVLFWSENFIETKRDWAGVTNNCIEMQQQWQLHCSAGLVLLSCTTGVAMANWKLVVDHVAGDNFIRNQNLSLLISEWVRKVPLTTNVNRVCELFSAMDVCETQSLHNVPEKYICKCITLNFCCLTFFFAHWSNEKALRALVYTGTNPYKRFMKTTLTKWLAPDELQQELITLTSCRLFEVWAVWRLRWLPGCWALITPTSCSLPSNRFAWVTRNRPLVPYTSVQCFAFNRFIDCRLIHGSHTHTKQKNKEIKRKMFTLEPMKIFMSAFLY